MPGLAPRMIDQGTVQMVKATVIHQSNVFCCQDLIVRQVNMQLHFLIIIK